ncbi:unnamed protein product [Phaeothamnion confervicola]
MTRLRLVLVALAAATGWSEGATLIPKPDIPQLLFHGELAETYGPLDALNPDRTIQSSWPMAPITFTRTRNEPGPLYAGLQMWESRGAMSVRRAVMAMLGDPTIYYEAPLFTAYRLLALGRTYDVHKYIYHSLGCGGYNDDALRDGYNDFFHMVTFRSYDNAENGGFPLAANEAEAAALAKALVDDFFNMPPEEFRERYMRDDVGGTEGRALLDPAYALYATMCKRMAWYAYAHDQVFSATKKLYVAPQMLVLEPAACARSIDLNYMELKESYEGHLWRVVFGIDPMAGRDFAKEVTAENFDDVWWRYSKNLDLCQCTFSTDFTQVMAPGYHPPQDIAAMEYGNYGFYRIRWRGRAHVAVLESFTRCVMRTPPPGDLSTAANLRGGGSGGGSGDAGDRAPVSFSFCHDYRCPPDVLNYCGATPLVAEEPATLVPAVAVLFALAGSVSAGAGGDGDGPSREAMLAAQAAAAVDAAALLSELNGRKTSAAATPPRVAAKGADGLPLLPTWLPPQQLLQLLNMRAIVTGQDETDETGEGEDPAAAAAGLSTLAAAAGAVAVGNAWGSDGAAEGAAMHQWSLGLPHADEARRPSVGDVLRQRAIASRTAMARKGVGS